MYIFDKRQMRQIQLQRMCIYWIKLNQTWVNQEHGAVAEQETEHEHTTNKDWQMN